MRERRSGGKAQTNNSLPVRLMNSKNRVLERKTTQRGGAAEVDGGVSGD
jgi:hypothetical protein